jgi:hypothetical protein
MGARSPRAATGPAGWCRVGAFPNSSAAPSSRTSSRRSGSTTARSPARRRGRHDRWPMVVIPLGDDGVLGVALTSGGGVPRVPRLRPHSSAWRRRREAWNRGAGRQRFSWARLLDGVVRLNSQRRLPPGWRWWLAVDDAATVSTRR